jgi:hypothetical protein
MCRTILAASATMCLFLLVAATTALACPPGSRFSGYNGNGVCVYIGQGLATAVKCQTWPSRACPKGSTSEKSGSDPNHLYCCPTKATYKRNPICVWRGTGPICVGDCEVGETVQARSDEGCTTGSKSFCCH